MTILMTGGGTGGHVTPLLAVAREIKSLQPDASLVYVGQKNDTFSNFVIESRLFDRTFLINAGKFRRYHGHGKLKQAFDLKTQALNIRDSFRTLRGTFQSYRFISKVKPDAVFSKGGYVAVPVGIAAHWHKCPIITHDSDAVPGLANKIVGKWASIHAVGLPVEQAGGQRMGTRYVGTPVDSKYCYVDYDLQNKYRSELGIPSTAPMLFVSGGGQGAKRINTATLQILEQLFAKIPNAYVVMAVGAANKDTVARDLEMLTVPKNQIKIEGFIANQEVYSGAATVVVSRAGATTTAELAVQGKTVIMIPSPVLAGNHQVINASLLEEKGAVLLVHEKAMLAGGPNNLLDSIVSLLTDESRRKQYAQQLHALAKPNAAEETAILIIGLAGGNAATTT